MNLSPLIAALILVESSGNPNPPPGKNGELGPLQIRACVIEDVNWFHRTKFVHADALELPKAVQICALYLEIWATEDRLGRPVTDRDRARIWNGGPDGWREPGTMKYWQRVERRMKR